MNIYLVQRADLNAVDYDEWDSIVVIAESQEAAFEIHPSFWVGERYYPHQGWGCGRDEPPLRVCHLLGTAKDGSVAGLVLASFRPLAVSRVAGVEGDHATNRRCACATYSEQPRMGAWPAWCWPASTQDD